MSDEKMNLYIANPRGFCAGVDRAINIVEMALEKYGAPVYVRHEIVHNKYVVEGLIKRGAIFVDELDEVPGDKPVVFSAHGVPKSVPAEAQSRNMLYIDATCPLVSKVHREAERYDRQQAEIVMIGHKGHPEVIGTMGQLAEGSIHLVEGPEDVQKLELKNADNVAYITQTTLSLDDTSEIIAALKQRFPSIQDPKKEDICYATTNRQNAVKALAEKVDVVLIIGAPNSSNSRRLVEVAQKVGCRSMLIQRASEINWSWFDDVKAVGISAGASAPEILVEEVMAAFNERYHSKVENILTIEENVTFKVPAILLKED
ncbi:MAG: 4-hydroxy-3-methylbut-2-enyl diphosphate reductase [Kordiimonadaceae bacterium]|jgi:4-hydroxy-3-methylbut-2-en-1-yl diphosphate reductase|nr:4-hydroxy-3-methylbut-2-enyl diphosphate reductase [Kordiimonadaceae bacterium]MBT6036764.1 4-hydroxy-3-methylbut-2-enyl diphosphate reductase [Kordiimonadaceae bacterium]MBT6330298.1 4-hydroxy-3-methylbut-2-enyl diphosphate reductase [Kordiimonadaceae bacterium]MBT7582941.1 4-hydroxy-3-methylbut-2-enyl diphosphate reductase [Kordiimonadaceae bacterium]